MRTGDSQEMTRGDKGKLFILLVPLCTLSLLSKIVCSLCMSYELNKRSEVESRACDSGTKRTDVVVGYFEKNPWKVPRSCFLGVAEIFSLRSTNSKRYNEAPISFLHWIFPTPPLPGLEHVPAYFSCLSFFQNLTFLYKFWLWRTVKAISLLVDDVAL